MKLPATVIVAGQAMIALPLLLMALIARRDSSAFLLSNRPTPFRLSGQLTIIGAMGVLAALDHLCFTLGVQKTHVANVVVLVYLYPVFTALLASRFLGEKLGVQGFFAFALGMSGTLLVVSANLGEFDRTDQLASLLGIAVAACVAARRILAKRLAPEITTMTVVTATTLIIAIAFSPLLLASEYSVTWYTASVLVVSALTTGAVASLLILAGVRKLDANRAAVLSYAEPFVAVLLAWLFLTERPGPLVVSGGVLIAGSAYLVTQSGFSLNRSVP